MVTLAIQRQGSHLGVKNGALLVSVGGERVQTVRPHELTEVHLYGDVECSAAARALLLSRGVDVLLLTPRGEYRGRIAAQAGGWGERRLSQLRWLGDDARRLGLARAVVAGKLTSQRRLLLQYRRRSPDTASREVLTRALVGLGGALAGVPSASALDVLMGLEGLGARHYFEGLRYALRAPWVEFAGRTRRPPRDPVNAALSFGYMLTLRRVEAALWRAGLEPDLGALHSPRRGVPALALDVLEELRVVLVDRLVLRLFNRGQLQAQDFERGPSVSEAEALDIGAPPPAAESSSSPQQEPVMGVWLSASGRQIFLREWFDAWRAPVPYAQGAVSSLPLEEALTQQGLSLLRIFTGAQESYQPLILEER
jgi:CRISPR-associated protein Cas1